MTTKFTIVYDNNDFDHQLKTDWGFGCVIQYDEHCILFDTGAKADVLLENLKAASIDPKSINKIVVSHKHWDHKGGLLEFTEINPDVEVYLPIDFPKNSLKILEKRCKKVERVKKSRAIDSQEKLFLIRTRSVWVKEQSLAVRTSSGVVVVTGCSHSGIHRIVKKAKKITGMDMYGALGGFHLFRKAPSKIWKTVNALKAAGIQKVSPCHCTGQEGFRIFKEAFPENYTTSGVGAKFEF
ncbi:MAG: MBL fold metallo-hydrolase [Alphaproteobacteria bacterium]|nr:MBL fold metallo-hydrolase [Alphaproteobacteria bacterium]